MTKYLKSWRNALEERGMSVSRPKPTGRNVGSNKLKNMNNLKYLGAVVEENRGMDMEIRYRVSAVWGNWKKCRGVWCDRNMPVKQRGKNFFLYRNVIRPALLYRAATW